MPPRLLQPRDLVDPQIALHFRRNADGERARWNLHPLAYQRSGADEGQVADARAVQNARAHSDESAASDGATMRDDSMSDGDLLGDVNWMRAVRHVQNAVVLDVCPRT